MTTPQTTFASGVNPFGALITKTKPMKQKTIPMPKSKGAKPAPIDSYATEYKPAMVTTGTASPAPVNPFDQVKASRRKLAQADLGSMAIVDDPIPEKRLYLDRKYEALLSKIKPGQAVRCRVEDVGRVCGAMRSFVERRKLDMAVRSVNDYGDGWGRVWMVERV